MKVLTFADLHLRDTVPSCVDATHEEWMRIQRDALEKVLQIAVDNRVDEVLVGGDIFHSNATASFECITMFQIFSQNLADSGIITRIMAGNHDLPQHSSTNVNKSAIGVLLNSDCILDMKGDSVIRGCNFDEDDYKGCKAIFKHVLCMPEKDKPSFVECETPQTLLDKYKSARFIFTGDYHRNFVYKSLDERYVINSGCLTKQASDFEDYETGVYIVDLETCDIRWCSVNVEQKFVRNGSSVKADKSVEDFVSGIKKESVTLDFIGTLRNKLDGQKKDVKDKVEEWIENIGQ
jgi:DNA repair exonuclease SbcCD nuclease subunit